MVSKDCSGCGGGGFVWVNGDIVRCLTCQPAEPVTITVSDTKMRGTGLLAHDHDYEIVIKCKQCGAVFK